MLYRCEQRAGHEEKSEHGVLYHFPDIIITQSQPFLSPQYNDIALLGSPDVQFV